LIATFAIHFVVVENLSNATRVSIISYIFSLYLVFGGGDGGGDY
jgi:hypothetical protein